MYLVIIFMSPLYLAIRKKWGAFSLNLILYILAWVTVWIFGLGVLFWALGVGHAMWHFRHQVHTEQAQAIAVEIAKRQNTQAENTDNT